VESTSTVSVDTWTYVVFSLELKTETTTDIIFFIANSGDTAITSTVFYVDNNTYKGTVGAERDTGTTYATRFNGFIYDFIVY
jgi:hypothetical protein